MKHVPRRAEIKIYQLIKYWICHKKKPELTTSENFEYDFEIQYGVFRNTECSRSNSMSFKMS